MINLAINLLMPHYCCSCGEIGAVLCESCKYDIVSEPFEQCLVCLRPMVAASQLCSSCHEPYADAWCVGERNDALKAAINLYKYRSARAAADQLVDLLDHAVPHLPDETRIVAVPTVSAHARIRGYDHMRHIAKHLATRRGLKLEHGLRRVDSARQQGSSRQRRFEQARHAFRCESVEHVPHLLIDDVYTTGATVHYASKALLAAGASEVYVAVLSRQPLEND